MQQHYVALVHGAPGAYGISFPDFPGCISAGASVDAVVRLGIEALHYHMEGMVEDGAAIPAPSSVEDIRVNPEFSEDLRDAVVTLVPVVTPAGKPMRINVSLDEALVAAIDKAAERAGQTRSGFLAEAARRALKAA
jgi:predicted RNase H-like HicB family nuclease